MNNDIKISDLNDEIDSLTVKLNRANARCIDSQYMGDIQGSINADNEAKSIRSILHAKIDLRNTLKDMITLN